MSSVNEKQKSKFRVTHSMKHWTVWPSLGTLNVVNENSNSPNVDGMAVLQISSSVEFGIWLEKIN